MYFLFYLYLYIEVTKAQEFLDLLGISQKVNIMLDFKDNFKSIDPTHNDLR